MDTETDKRYKVIDKDNLNREHVADQLVADNCTLEEAELFCKQQNEGRGEHTYYWAVVVPQSYRLSRGMEDLI